MTLSFTLEDGLFVAEFEATSRFNLHLERPASGSIYMKQKTVKDGSYVIVKDFGWNRDGDLIIDADCGQGAVYPKWIRIESAVKPSVAEVTFESESSGGGAGESTWRYFDISKCSIEGIETMAHIVKTYRDGGHIGIVSSGALSMAGSSTERIAMGIDMAVGFCPIVGSTEIINYGEHLAPTISDILANGAVEITKEQFYNLEA